MFRTEYSGLFQTVFFPFPYLKLDFFFLLYLWETYGAPDDKSHNIVGWVSLEF